TPIPPAKTGPAPTVKTESAQALPVATPTRPAPTMKPMVTIPRDDSTRITTLALAGIVVACALCFVRICYYVTRPVLLPLVKHKQPVDCVAFSPDGRWIATGGDDNSLCIWSTSDGTLRRTIQGHDGHIMTV